MDQKCLFSCGIQPLCNKSLQGRKCSQITKWWVKDWGVGKEKLLQKTLQCPYWPQACFFFLQVYVFLPPRLFVGYFFLPLKLLCWLHGVTEVAFFHISIVYLTWSKKTHNCRKHKAKAEAHLLKQQIQHLFTFKMLKKKIQIQIPQWLLKASW